MKNIVLSITIILLLMVSGFTEEKTGDHLNKRLMIVSGTDYVEALPDTAYFNFSASVEKNSPEEAASVGEALKNNIIAAVKALGIEKKDVLEDASGISERYDYENKKTFHAFTYSTRIRLTDFSRIAVLRKALMNERTFAPVQEAWFTKRGLSVNQQVSYEIVLNKSSVEKEALRKACENALSKLDALADLNKITYSIYRIEEASAAEPAYPQVRAFAAMEKTADNDTGAGALDTIPTVQRIIARVTVKAEII